MAAGLATLHVLREERIIEHAASVGRRLKSGLSTLVPKYELVRDMRGRGLLLAVEFEAPKNPQLKTEWTQLDQLDSRLFPQAILIRLLTDHRIFAQGEGNEKVVIKLSLPLVLSHDDADAIVNAFDQIVAACKKFPGPIREIDQRLAQQAPTQRSPEPINVV